MISNGYLRMMSRYNRWQNEALFDAAAALSEMQRREERGAFWGSIHGTLSHLYWADQIWASRLGLTEKPTVPLKDSARYIDDWQALRSARAILDEQLIAWSDTYEVGSVQGTITWFSGVMGREVDAPLSVILPHIFNHQTHHRGQAHALITGLGGVTADTDLFMMPVDRWPPDFAT